MKVVCLAVLNFADFHFNFVITGHLVPRSHPPHPEPIPPVQVQEPQVGMQERLLED